MHYTVKEEDTSMSAGGLNTVFEVLTVIVVVLLCAWVSRVGYPEYGALIAIVVLLYYFLVAYTKLMFSGLKAGTTYEFEPVTLGINLKKDKSTIIWMPVFVFRGKEEKLNLYALSITVVEEDTNGK